jgi:hypothetical protein
MSEIHEIVAGVDKDRAQKAPCFAEAILIRNFTRAFAPAEIGPLIADRELEDGKVAHPHPLFPARSNCRF